MTDNEIKKALECHTKEDGVCTECPLYPNHSCFHILSKGALDLVNRKQAEIEQWKKEANRYQNLYCMSLDDIGKAKSEAVKGFAERLEENITYCHTVSDGEYVGYDRTDITRCINNLVKEMVGDTE